MSDVSQGTGWWQASDGKWYAPEMHPDYRPPPPTAAQAPPLPPPPPSYQSNSWSQTPPSAPAGPAPSDRAPFSFDLKRFSQADRITGVATAVLFISLFLPWYTYSFGIGSISLDGLWHGWMYLSLLLCLATIAYFVLRAGYDELPFNLPITERQLLLIATVANVVLALIAFLSKPGGLNGIGWGFGAFLGLAAAVAAAVPQVSPALKGRNS